jgi:hypothetical protein
MSRYHELAAKVDGFFARVMARHGGDMQCESGCSDCCAVRLSVTAVERDAICDFVAGWSSERLAALKANARAQAPDRCAALDPGGRCLIYDARPIVCRSHGAPIRMTERSLPVVQACFRNFTDAGPAAADPDCILDQTTLSALVLAVDRDGGGDGTRFELAELLASC